MIEDSSQIKYLKGKDKEIWEAFCKRHFSNNKEKQGNELIGAPKEKKVKSVLDTIPTII